MPSAARAAHADVRLRAMHRDDVRAVAAIEAASFGDPWPASAFTELMRQAHVRLQVAVDDDDRVVGYCVVLRVVDEAEVANIATHPAERRRGIGALLLDDALAHADANGTLAMFLEVRVSNAAARALYTSRGFQLVGRRRGYYQHPDEDALVLRRSAPPDVATVSAPAG